MTELIISSTKEELEIARLKQERDELAGKLKDAIQVLLGAKSRAELAVIAIFGTVGFPSISLDCTTSGEILALADAIERQVPTYNDFKGSSVAAAIRELHGKGLIMNAEFGREASPVLYVEPPYWTGQASNLDRLGKDWDLAHGQSRKFTATERKIMFEEISNVLYRCGPDELGYCESTRSGTYEHNVSAKTRYVRAWFD